MKANILIKNIMIRFSLKDRTKIPSSELKALCNEFYWKFFHNFLNQIHSDLTKQNRLDNHLYSAWVNVQEMWSNGLPLGVFVRLPFNDIIERRKQEEFLLDAPWFAAQVVANIRRKDPTIKFRVEIGISYGDPDTKWISVFDSTKDAIENKIRNKERKTK